MPAVKTLYPFLFVTLLLAMVGSHASAPVKENQFKDIKKTAIDSEKDKQRLQDTAVLLARYEIEAKRLIDMLAEKNTGSNGISDQAGKLMSLSEEVIMSARFRLPQCDDYLAKSITLKDRLGKISHDQLETDYHMDGALPKAPAECYHTKDLFVHPATVKVLTRDDPALTDTTRSSIKAEIEEVLAHTEVVRQLVIY
ncbi:MAG TPA: hypothetical protein VJ981_02315 [Gammaproteobacteria bacterium]|nr:hypothetical protein [Gammaproteobacteria bacterium]